MQTKPDLSADVGEILLSEDEIQAKVAELGARISTDYAGRSLTLVSVLKGSLPFMADLMRAITIPDQFVVGYGLDYGEIYRNLRFVGVLRREVYAGGAEG